MLFVRARTPSTAGYACGNSFAVRIRLNIDLNLTPNPIRTHDRAPNLTDPGAKKLRPVGVELVTWGKTVLFQPERSAYWAKQAHGEKRRQMSIQTSRDM